MYKPLSTFDHAQFCKSRSNRTTTKVTSLVVYITQLMVAGCQPAFHILVVSCALVICLICTSMYNHQLITAMDQCTGLAYFVHVGTTSSVLCCLHVILIVCSSEVVYCYCMHAQRCAEYSDRHLTENCFPLYVQSLYTFSWDDTPCGEGCHRIFPICKIILQMSFIFTGQN